MVIVQSLHTTTAVFINEFQQALMDDIKSFLGAYRRPLSITGVTTIHGFPNATGRTPLPISAPCC